MCQLSFFLTAEIPNILNKIWLFCRVKKLKFFVFGLFNLFFVLKSTITVTYCIFKCIQIKIKGLLTSYVESCKLVVSFIVLKFKLTVKQYNSIFTLR